MYDSTESPPPYLVKRIAQIAVWLFGISFGIGTLLLLAQAGSNDRYQYYWIGFLYVVAAVIVNATAFFVLLIHSYIYVAYRKILLRRAALLVINIPNAILYMYIVFKIL